jgi:hypothetical protein
MRTNQWGLAGAFAIALLIPGTAPGTLIPRLSFEQLTDTSELVVAGRITDSYAAWDSEHKYIWTHYHLKVSSSLKGSPTAVVEFAEPGGAVGADALSVAGTVAYSPNENVVVFLARMPNGYLRTAGWSQGKYGLDEHNRLHASASLDAGMLDAKANTGMPLTTLEGMDLADLGRRIAARTGRTR